MSRLHYRQPRIQNLGAAIGLVLKAAERCAANEADISADLAAFHAPSECNAAAFRNVRAPMEEAMEQVWELTGHPWWMVVQEAKARTGGRWVGWTFHSLGVPEARSFEEG
jgi:hypothetical protein